MRRSLSIVAAVAVALASFGIFASPAAAHESRVVGPYTFVVGWVVEPALVAQGNGLDLTVTETNGDKPVDGLDKMLTAQLIVGPKTRALQLVADADKLGHYTSSFVPTRVGDYTFHISGMAGTTKIDEKFDSGPNRFAPVTDIVSLEFPDQVPSTADLAQQLADANTKLTVSIALAALAILVSGASLALAMRRR